MTAVRRETAFRLSHEDGPLQLDPGDVLEAEVTGRRWLVVTCRRPVRGPRMRRLWICRVVRMADDEPVPDDARVIVFHRDPRRRR